MASGVAAGIAATAAQVALWLLFTDAFPAILFRDARFAAAIALGPTALTSVDFGWQTMLVASLVHLALSLLFAVLICLITSRSKRPLLVATAAGLCVYAINMHFFTIFFPWFVADRDWITIVAHATFGISAAAVYRTLAARLG